MSIKQGSNYLAVSNVSVDGDTISANAYNSLQSIGTVNKNQAQGSTNPVYIWTGTYAEFTAQDIANTHPEWLCYITDAGGEIGRVYTAAEVDRLLVNKANTNADNFTSAGKDYLAGLSFMGERFEQLVPISGMSYTAPADGYFCIEGILVNTTGNRLYLLYRPNQTYLYGNKTASMSFGALSSYRQYSWLPVKKGGVVYVTAESTATNPDFGLRFYYADGADYTPPEYTPIEYIEGTSNVQYIKAGILPNSAMKLYCKAQITGNTAFCVFGTRNATYDGAQMNISLQAQNVVVDWFGGTNSANRWTVSTSVVLNDTFELEVENSVATLTKNGTVIGTRIFTPTGSVTRELYLTALDNNGALGGAGTTGRLYEFKLWDSNGDLIMDMQPVKDSANVACLYNTVSQTLYYNHGTGIYTAGPDINE